MRICEQVRALSWFRSYLHGRTYHVQIDGASSECIPLWCGVPQGSVLGPIKFTMFTAPINRILQRHGASYHTYADDIQLYVSFKPKRMGIALRLNTMSNISLIFREYGITNDQQF